MPKTPHSWRNTANLRLQAGCCTGDGTATETTTTVVRAPGCPLTCTAAARPTNGTGAGTAYVIYNHTTREHCAVLVRAKPGTRMFMEVTLDTSPTSGAPARDYGSFKEYAGPVHLDARGGRPVPGVERHDRHLLQQHDGSLPLTG
ncbi:hypothetical protein [Streptomyces sp. SID12501]|uniref:hypothetical protein n=1 Tax=Streptomyces sp. SID12501 TaxID=2706042 RepID=UPI0019441D94|nr:hypothetical protein [Streptomyces sp. SID12501]